MTMEHKYEIIIYWSNDDQSPLSQRFLAFRALQTGKARRQMLHAVELSDQGQHLAALARIVRLDLHEIAPRVRPTIRQREPRPRTRETLVYPVAAESGGGVSAIFPTNALPSRNNCNSVIVSDRAAAPSPFQRAAYRPRSRRLAYRHNPVPSHSNTFARFL
jgi:hypothetical protein